MSKHRRLSVHQEHELLIKLEEAGLDENIAQLIIESKDNELADKVVQFIMTGGFSPTSSQRMAREVLPKGLFFGPEEWITHSGIKVEFSKDQLDRIAEIPLSEKELKKPKINQPHFVFLGVDKPDDEPLNLKEWKKICPGPNHPKLFSDWILKETFAKETCQFRWYSMPVGIVKGSDNLTYQQQLDMLPDSYEVPNVIERVTANFLFHKLNQKYLDQVFWARVRDKEKDFGYRVGVGGWADGGVCVNDWYDGACSRIGVAASRKLKS